MDLFYTYVIYTVYMYFGKGKKYLKCSMTSIVVDHYCVLKLINIAPQNITQWFFIVKCVKHFILCTDYHDYNLLIIHLERAYSAL